MLTPPPPMSRLAQRLQIAVCALAAYLCSAPCTLADVVRVGVSEVSEGSLLASSDGASRILQSALFSSIAEQPPGTFQVAQSEPGVLTITHERDVACADGGDLTTRDLVFSIGHCLKIRGIVALVERLGTTDITNDSAAGITVRGDPATLTSVVSCPLMRAWAMSSFGERGGFVDTGVGCGAFKVDSLSPGRKITLSRRAGEEESVQTLTIQRTQGDSPRLSLLRRADIDIFIDPTEEELSSLREDPTLITVQCDGFALATRRALRIRCEPYFFASFLRWEHGSSHEQK